VGGDGLVSIHDISNIDYVEEQVLNNNSSSLIEIQNKAKDAIRQTRIKINEVKDALQDAEFSIYEDI